MSIQHESTNQLRVIHGPNFCDLPHRGSFKPRREKNSQGWKHLWLPLTRQRGSQSVGPHRRTRCSPGPRLRRPSGPGRPSSLEHAGPLCWGKRQGEKIQWTSICFPKPREFEVELWEDAGHCHSGWCRRGGGCRCRAIGKATLGSHSAGIWFRLWFF